MNAILLKRITRTLRLVVGFLVSKAYDDIEALTNAVRLKAEYIDAGVLEYGEVLVQPPEDAYENIDVIQIQGKIPAEYSVRFNLFTASEGRSDLALELTLIDKDKDKEILEVEFDNIHVL